MIEKCKKSYASRGICELDDGLGQWLLAVTQQ
jgi:hypothetical protein